MDEKQRLMEAEAAQTAAVESIPPPPAYTDVEVSVETIAVIKEEALRMPAWISRLPVTLPLAHFMFSVPLALFFARSFGDAVFICSGVSFWLVASATAGLARATRHDIRLQKAGVRYLGAAGMIMVAWPFIIGILLAPGHMSSRCQKMMRHHHHHQAMPSSHPHNHHAGQFEGVRAFHLHPSLPIPAIRPDTSDVSSSKGHRVLVTAVSQRLEGLKTFFPAAVGTIHAAHVRVVVSSKGVKALLHNEKEATQQTPESESTNEEELR